MSIRVAASARRSAQLLSSTTVATRPRKTSTPKKTLPERTSLNPPTPPRERSYYSATPTTADKTKQTFGTSNPPGPSLSTRIFTTRNLCILGAGAGAVAIASSLAVLSAKVGTLGASQLLAANLIAFLQPGLVITGFALKAGLTVTMSAALPVVLPIASTVLVSGLGIVLTIYLIKKVAEKMFNGLNSAKDAVLALPKKLIEQVPGGSTVLALFQSSQENGEIEIKPMSEGELAEIREYRPTFGMDEEEFLAYHRTRIDKEKEARALELKTIAPTKEHSSGLQELAEELAQEAANPLEKEAIEDRPDEKKEMALLLRRDHAAQPAGGKRSLRARKPVIAKEEPNPVVRVPTSATPPRNNGVFIAASLKKSADF